MIKGAPPLTNPSGRVEEKIESISENLSQRGLLWRSSGEDGGKPLSRKETIMV